MRYEFWRHGAVFRSECFARVEHKPTVADYIRFWICDVKICIAFAFVGNTNQAFVCLFNQYLTVVFVCVIGVLLWTLFRSSPSPTPHFPGHLLGVHGNVSDSNPGGLDRGHEWLFTPCRQAATSYCCRVLYNVPSFFVCGKFRGGCLSSFPLCECPAIELRGFENGCIWFDASCPLPRVAFFFFFSKATYLTMFFSFF